MVSAEPGLVSGLVFPSVGGEPALELVALLCSMNSGGSSKSASRSADGGKSMSSYAIAR